MMAENDEAIINPTTERSDERSMDEIIIEKLDNLARDEEKENQKWETLNNRLDEMERKLTQAAPPAEEPPTEPPAEEPPTEQPPADAEVILVPEPPTDPPKRKLRGWW